VIAETDELDQDAIDALAHHIAAVAFEQDESMEVDFGGAHYVEDTEEVEVTAITGWELNVDDGVIECHAETTVERERKVSRETRWKPAAYETIEREVLATLRADWTGTYPLCGDCEIRLMPL